jgi:hypothetical protein
VDLSVLVVTGFVKLIQAKISPKTIGGPILKDKLLFFGAYEYSTRGLAARASPSWGQPQLE